MARPQPQPQPRKKTHKKADDQQVERLHQGYAQSMEITRVLVDEQSKFQHIRIFDTVANGRVMTLDDIVQITDRDESAYADMLTHLPMLEHGKVERVMVKALEGNFTDITSHRDLTGRPRFTTAVRR